MQCPNKCFNYADDNTISTFSETVAGVVRNLYPYGTEMVAWFNIIEKLMQASSSKFQYKILFGTEDRHLELMDDIVVDSLDCVRLFGVDNEEDLNISVLIARIYKKASK